MFFRFVLRGRPGLGHVIPGLRIARALLGRGHRVQIVTYGAGSALRAGSFFEDWVDLEVGQAFRDWPGLHPYDDALGSLGQIWRNEPAAVTVLGGEYLLPAVAPAMGGGHVVALINPEIGRDAPYNGQRGEVLAAFLHPANHLLPLTSPSPKMLPSWRPLLRRCWPAGPIAGPLLSERVEDGGRRGGRLFVISTGGGIDFPQITKSYTGSEVSPRTWVEQTSDMTRLAAVHLLKVANASDAVAVFSCLREDWMTRLVEDLDDDRLKVSAVSLEFHDVAARADVLVCRAGVGGLADAMAVPGTGVLWALEEHQEQIRNLRTVAVTANDTQIRWCLSPDDLVTALDLAVGDEPRTPSRTRLATQACGVPAQVIARRLEACGLGRCQEEIDDVAEVHG
jgi:hypothetical protein